MATVFRIGLMSIFATLSLAAQVHAQGTLELTTELGRKLYALPDDQTVIDARKVLAADPKNVELVIKLSKAEAARRQYREAVATDTEGLKSAPGNADLYLERGHRELGLREFQQARTDLEHAAKLDPSMLDAHYHLGLANYFLGEFKAAAASFEQARSLAKTDDSLIDCSNWLYVSLRRAGEDEQASEVLKRITPEVKNTEPHLYFYLRLLHFYQGKLTAAEVLPAPPSGPDDIEGELSFNTVSYGVGNWRLYHHDREAALPLFKSVVKGQAWNSWGFIGSEVELIRDKHK
jgi:tetratricopeptide (TPR) repeat protein